MIYKSCFIEIPISFLKTKSLNSYQKFILGAIKYIRKTKQHKRNFLKQIKTSFITNKSQFIYDTTKDLDWFSNYTITDEMKLYTKLNTPLAFAIFKFIQPHLKDFKSGQIRQQNKQQTISNSENIDQESKYIFKYLLRSLASQ